MKQPLCLLLWLLPAALSVKCKRQLLLLLGLLLRLLHAINLLMKTGNKLGQLRPKGRRQTDKNPTPSAKKCAKELINKAVEHVGISISYPPPLFPLSVLCLVHSTLTLCTLCKTDELFAAHARTCSLLNARCDASVDDDVDVAARFSAQAARMRIIKRQRRRRHHHHRRRRSCSLSSPSSPYPSSSSCCQRAAQRRLAAFAFLILHFSIALQLVGVACTSTECAAAAAAAKWRQMQLAAGACVFA